MKHLLHTSLLLIFTTDFTCNKKKIYSTIKRVGQYYEHDFDKVEIDKVLLTDFSTDFNCFLHDVLVAKLGAYRFDNNPLR